MVTSIGDLRLMRPEHRVPHLMETLLCAVKLTLEVDAGLFAIGVHEQAVTHRIAVYLERLLEPQHMSVDCEYNRDVAAVKTYKYSVTECDKAFRPDIILHERLDDQYNMLAVEAATTSQDAEKIGEDREKIVRVVSQSPYSYNLGAFLLLFNDAGITRPKVDVEFYTRLGKWSPLVSLSGEFDEKFACLAADRK